jgi:hypothetical protein
MIYNSADPWFTIVAGPWFTVRQIHGFQQSRSMVYNVADMVYNVHGLHCSTDLWFTMAYPWFTKLQYDRSMVYNAADTWFSMRQVHDLQLGRSMVYNAAG